MPIKVAHQIPGAAAAGAAFEGGRGEKARFDRQLKLSYDKLAAQVNTAAANRASASSSRSADRAASLYKFDKAQEAAVVSGERRFEQGIERMSFADDLATGQMEFKYTKQQENRMNALSQAEATLEEEYARGDWREPAYQDAKGQIHAARLGIKPPPYWNSDKTAQQRMDSDAVLHAPTGTWFLPDGKGGSRQIQEKVERMSDADHLKMFLGFTEIHTGEDLNGNKIRANPRAVQADMDGYLESRRRYLASVKSQDEGGVTQGGQELSRADRGAVEMARIALGDEDAAELEQILRFGTPEKIQIALDRLKSLTAKRR